MHRTAYTALGAALALSLVMTAAHGKSIFGWIERVKLENAAMTLEAKLDTGAETSSLHAPDAETFERDGDTWVRFTVEDAEGEEHAFERPLSRTVRIRSAAGVTRRYVVTLSLCLGDIARQAEVTLADREELSYPMLIGRNFLDGHILVDSGPKFTRDPACATGEDGDDGTRSADADADGETS